jgi:hypothetical protein
VGSSTLAKESIMEIAEKPVVRNPLAQQLLAMVKVAWDAEFGDKKPWPEIQFIAPSMTCMDYRDDVTTAAGFHRRVWIIENDKSRPNRIQVNLIRLPLIGTVKGDMSQLNDFPKTQVIDACAAILHFLKTGMHPV